MNSKKLYKGRAYFCYSESKNVKMVSGKSKVRVESMLTGIGTSSRLYFTDELTFGSYIDVEIEFLSDEVHREDLKRSVPLLMTFAPSMPFGLFISTPESK